MLNQQHPRLTETVKEAERFPPGHRRIWAVIDKPRATYRDMALFHGGYPVGGDHMSACGARDCKVNHVRVRPDWTRFQNGPFRRIN